MTPTERSSFLRASAFLFVIINSGSFFSFLFKWQVNRGLDSNDAVGAINTLLTFVGYLVIPGLALQLVASRLAAHATANNDPSLIRMLWRKGLGLVGYLTALYALTLWIGADFFVERFHFESSSSLVVVVLLALVHLPWFIGIGILQGQQRFRAFGTLQALPYWLKCVFGIGAVWLGFQATGIIGGLILAHGLPVLAVLVALRETFTAGRQHSAATPSISYRTIVGDAIPLLLNFGAFTLLVTADIPFARATFGDSGEGLDGLYAAAAELARSVFYLPLALVHLTFARVAEARALNKPHRHLLWKSLALTGGLSIFGSAILFSKPKFFLLMYGGEKLVDAVPLLRAYLLPSILLGLLSVFMHYYFALGKRSFSLLILLGAGLALLAYELWHDNPLQIISGLTAVAAVLVVVSLLLLPVLASDTEPDELPHRDHKSAAA